MPNPCKPIEKRVRDMMRISDGQMSGTACGTPVLHVAPESAADGRPPWVHTGEPIVLDVPRGGWTSTSLRQSFDAGLASALHQPRHPVRLSLAGCGVQAATSPLSSVASSTDAKPGSGALRSSWASASAVRPAFRPWLTAGCRQEVDRPHAYLADRCPGDRWQFAPTAQRLRSTLD